MVLAVLSAAWVIVVSLVANLLFEKFPQSPKVLPPLPLLNNRLP
jgi:hypothetical protein